MNKEISNAEEKLSANAAGKLLGVSGKTVIRMMEAGDFPGYKIGSAWKFRRGDIENYLESRKFVGKKAVDKRSEEDA
ncbi:PTS system nitrogen regulatory IIA component [Thermosporothrix hazakensis]|jgi:excisionase family DNA binding protein|uniref:PTS system nitrogen regulatory IIA component n=1 Tax=Thermosporothrix hazakensis TaxID=644383 RepID=A0A326TZW7_THEHA|nr:helix-turn-helix domain-containing protein [Thermosporothrix hazakensis]PZW22424.1 PTS system nitrogen regulatory IIA component [Thermosporothrix hazakensis]GCE49178.1 hypothetical protein KTH_40470 [Thermosporothrix hazakensis]